MAPAPHHREADGAAAQAGHDEPRGADQRRGGGAAGGGAGGLGLTSRLSPARAGEAWSCTSPHADVTRVAIPRCPYRVLLPMPPLLTACMGDRPRHVQAAWGSNTSRGARKQALGTLPMRNGSRQGKAHPCQSANSWIYNICHTPPADERPLFPATFCGKV